VEGVRPVRPVLSHFSVGEKRLGPHRCEAIVRASQHPAFLLETHASRIPFQSRLAEIADTTWRRKGWLRKVEQSDPARQRPSSAAHPRRCWGMRTETYKARG
jgi:hypothetical protein